MVARVKNLLRLRWPSLLSAALYSLAFPPFNLWPLMFVALVPILTQLRTADSKNAWGIGFVFGSVAFLGQMYFLYALANHWIHRPFLALIPWLLTAAMAGFFYGWTARLIRHCYLRNWLILIPAAWTGIEVFRSYVPVLALPWGLVATPLYRAPILIQSAHYGTIYLVSAFVVLVNVVAALLTDAEERKKWMPPAFLASGIFVASVLQYTYDVAATPFMLTVGQPGVDLAFGNPHRRQEEIEFSVDRIAAKALADGSQLVVLPEGIGDDEFNRFPPQPPFRVDKRMPMLFGGQRGTGPIFQTAFSFDGKWHWADKTRLVIFGEFVPGRDTFPWIAKTFDLPAADLSASQKGVQAVDVTGVKAGPMLCFEGLFPEISFQQARNGAKFLAVMCVDDWYMGTSAPDQLKAAAFFRAVETGLPLVRSASLGWTLAIDAHGRLIEELPLKKADGLNVTIDLPDTSPTFPLLPVFPACVLVFAMLLPWLPRREA